MAAEAQRRQVEAEAERKAREAQHSSSCSTITGPGMGPAGPCDTPRPGLNTPIPPAPAATARPRPRPPSRVVLAPVPPCNACAALDAVAEILPQFGQVLDQMEQEINSPNIPPPEQWIAEPPPQSSNRQAVNAQRPDDSGGDFPRDKPGSLRLPPGFSLDDPFQLEAEPEQDYAQRCKEAFGEYLSGKDNPIETAKKKIRDLKKQGNSLVDIMRHPFDSAKDWLQAKIDEQIGQIDPHNYFKILEEQIRKAETKDHQEELKRFKEKWRDKCIENAYTKDIEEQLKQVLDEPSDSGEVR